MTVGTKRCAVCDQLILGCDVRLAAEEEERCHDCADYCDEPDCERCAVAGEKGLTNEGILRAPEALLGALEKQRKAMLQIAQLRRPCPVCGAHASLLEAAGITVNQYTFGSETLPYACARCGSRLEQVVPLLGGQVWFWKRKEGQG